MFVYACIFTYISNISIFVYIRDNTLKYTYIHTYVYILVHICMYTHTHIYVYIYMYICIYIYIHMCLHTPQSTALILHGEKPADPNHDYFAAYPRDDADKDRYWQVQTATHCNTLQHAAAHCNSHSRGVCVG